MTSAVALMASRIFEPKQLEKVYTSLTNKWDRYQSLHAAMKLMEAHGVKLTPEEEKELAGLDERTMIEQLVQKMPMNDKAQFQQFFLQLQIIVSTATKVRQALEASRPDLVQAALDEAESTGMSAYILKMAVVSAGYEVLSLQRQHETWVKDSEQRMSKLVRGQEDAMKARKKLNKAQSDLAMMKGKGDSKTKGVLMALAGGNETVIRIGAFNGWKDYTKQAKEERAIYEEFRERIEQVELQLVLFKGKHLKNISGVINKKFASTNQEMCKEVFVAWKEDYEGEKFVRENSALINDLEAKLKQAAEEQSASIQRMIMKMFGDSEAAMTKLTWQAFLAFHNDYQKNKEIEDQVKAMEAGLKAKMKGKSGAAGGIMSKMSGAADSACQQVHFIAWNNLVKEAKEEAEMAEKLAAAGSKFGSFGANNKGKAASALDRARMLGEDTLKIQVLFAWRLDIKMEKLMTGNQGKIEGKKAQLQKVQTMFRDFAVKLDSGIKSGQDSDRDFKDAARVANANKKAGSSKGMTRGGDGSVSLPDISSNKQVSPKAGHGDSDSKRSRDRSSGSGRPSRGGGTPSKGPPGGAYAYPNEAQR